MRRKWARSVAGCRRPDGTLYYAGHGVEHDGANLLVPVDVTARTTDELRYQAPPLQFLLRDMARADNKANAIILDACRDLPLPAGPRNGPAGGLDEIDIADVPNNVLIAYATRAGRTPDNPDLPNSRRTRILADEIGRNSRETVLNMLALVSSRVWEESGYAQFPEGRSYLLRNPVWLLSESAGPGTAPDWGLLRRAEEAERRVRVRVLEAFLSRAVPATPPQTVAALFAAERAPAALRDLVARARLAGQQGEGAAARAMRSCAANVMQRRRWLGLGTFAGFAPSAAGRATARRRTATAPKRGRRQRPRLESVKPGYTTTESADLGCSPIRPAARRTRHCAAKASGRPTTPIAQDN